MCVLCVCTCVVCTCVHVCTCVQCVHVYSVYMCVHVCTCVCTCVCTRVYIGVPRHASRMSYLLRCCTHPCTCVHVCTQCVHSVYTHVYPVTRPNFEVKNKKNKKKDVWKCLIPWWGVRALKWCSERWPGNTHVCVCCVHVCTFCVCTQHKTRVYTNTGCVLTWEMCFWVDLLTSFTTHTTTMTVVLWLDCMDEHRCFVV